MSRQCEERELEETEQVQCRVCGCTERRACLITETVRLQSGAEFSHLVPCSWVEVDLCSNPDCLKAAGLMMIEVPITHMDVNHGLHGLHGLDR